MEVVSSNIKSVEYKDNGLLVEYKGGTKYFYFDVPLEVYNGLVEAESKGRYMNESVKKAGFKYKKMNVE